MKDPRRLIPAAAVALALTAATTRAVELVPDTAVPLPGSTLLSRPELGGSLIASDLKSFSFSISGGGTVSGAIVSEVVRETAAGTLDFYWQVSLDPGSAGNIGAFRLGSFLTETYDADWRADGAGTVAPESGYLFSEPGYLNFMFDTALTPADGSSRLMFLHTDAIDYATDAEMDVAIPGFTSISDVFPTYSPSRSRSAVVPEPGTSGFGLAVCGLALLALKANRRRS